MPAEQITVTKQDAHGAPVLTYDGVVIARGETWVCLDAVFSRADVTARYVTFRRGDRMREWFFSDRWFNIFELHDVDDDRIKGWYCNVTRPAALTAHSVAAHDLALDVFIAPDGILTLLDEDEFAALDLPAHDRTQALAAVEQLRAWVMARRAPFDVIPALSD